MLFHVYLQFTNGVNISYNGKSELYNGTNATDIPLNIERGDDITVTVCDQNDASSCQVITPGAYVLFIYWMQDI